MEKEWLVLVMSVTGFLYLAFKLHDMRGLVNSRLTIALEEIRSLKKELGLEKNNTASLDRIEAATTAARRHGETVAQDLEDSHRRADETIGPHGAAADAASQSKKED
jgi:hypothetical protein